MNAKVTIMAVSIQCPHCGAVIEINGHEMLAPEDLSGMTYIYCQDCVKKSDLPEFVKKNMLGQ